MRVLLTGASGAIGTALREAATPDLEFLGVTRRQSREAGLVTADFSDAALFSQRGAFDAVVHLAAVLHTDSMDRLAAYETNLTNSVLLLNNALAAGVKRIVLFSSIGAVGCLRTDFQPLSIPLSDTHPCLNSEAYGMSKFAMESCARSLSLLFPTTEIVIFRVGAVSGTNEKDISIVPRGVMPRFPFVELAQVHLADVVDAVPRLFAMHPRAGVRIYNLVGPNVPTTWNVAELLTELGVTAAFDLASYDREGTDCPPLYDMSTFEHDFGYRPLRHAATGTLQ